MEPIDLDCPVCKCRLIGPHTIMCGHNICMSCFSLLPKPKCPVCRFDFKSKKHGSVNKLLESMLIPLISAEGEDYRDLYSEATHLKKIYEIMTKYHHSKRCYEYAKEIYNYLQENDHYIELSKCSEIFPDIPQNELHHIMGRNNSSTVITTGDTSNTYYVDITDLENIQGFLNKVGPLSDANMLRLLGAYDPDVNDLIKSHNVAYDRVILQKPEKGYADMAMYLTKIEAKLDECSTRKWDKFDWDWGSDSSDDESDDDEESHTMAQGIFYA